jgi:anti-sigma regulatory factor (Ser/Thr protein kinase)
MKKSIKFTLEPKGNDIENVVGKCSNFLKSNGLLDDTVRSQVMVVRELVRNAMKYGKFDNSENQMTVHIQINQSQIIVEVMNPVNERSLHKLKELDNTIQWIRGYQDPHEA